MAHFVRTNTQILMNEFNVSGDTNRVDLALKRRLEDDTTMGATWEKLIGGVLSMEFQVGGYADFADDAEDEVLFNGLTAASRVVTIGEVGGAVGNIAYSGTNIRSEYSVLGEHGSNTPFSASGQGSGTIVRGTILHDSSTARIASGNGSGSGVVQLGTVSATQRVYASLHVISASVADTLDVTVQSDNASNFPSATTRISFTQATAATAEFKSAAGAITDDYWRIGWTIGGSSPSFTFVVNVGIA